MECSLIRSDFSLTPSNLNSSAFSLRKAGTHWLAHLVFCFSTLFVVLLSVQALHGWSPRLKHYAIVLACLLPAVWVILSRVPSWISTRKVPRAVLWSGLVAGLGMISSCLSENPWVSAKSMVLFLISGPLVFLAALYFFELRPNRIVFLWLLTLILLGLGSFGMYEQAQGGEVHLLSDNTLPAGGLLILLLSGPVLLLERDTRLPLKVLLMVAIVGVVVLITLMGKKGPLLGLVVTLVLGAALIRGKSLKWLVGLLVLVGVLMVGSGTTLIKYKDAFGNVGSVAYRVENYFFGLHVFTRHPVWGVGYKADLTRFLGDYEIRMTEVLTQQKYRRYIEDHKTFENIILAFLVEAGGLFTLVYGTGIAYALFMGWNCGQVDPGKGKGIIICALVGFVVLSMTFDTLRFPNLNWLFHSLLGMMMAFRPDAVATK